MNQPIKSLRELIDWEEKDQNNRIIRSDPLQHADGGGLKGAGDRKLLVCHDMKGGYLPQDVCVDGFEVKNMETECPYYLTQWWYIDTFCYFSHHLVTIPPLQWINAPHKHGTKVLGTFITEWDEGREICRELMSDDKLRHRCVAQLVRLAKVFGFEGWLVNIENTIEENHVAALIEFVKELHRGMRNEIGVNSLVIWYDSVISTTGNLKWQNELNSLNSAFFDVCDGIFLNYTWKEEHLRRCSEFVAPERKHDVYVGVDVFGRGVLGGGGWNTAKALSHIQSAQLSVALFAPGWVHERHDDRSQFPLNNSKFWNLMKPQLPDYRKIRKLPIETFFTFGIDGKEDIVKFNLSNQNLQPHSLALHHDVRNKGHLTCLIDNSKKMVEFSLFEFDVLIKKDATFAFMLSLSCEHALEGAVRLFFNDTSVEETSFHIKKDLVKSLATCLPFKYTAPNDCHLEKLRIRLGSPAQSSSGPTTVYIIHFIGELK